ncbi:PREDICTED: putative methylesterase 13, chloroplastic [Camelina sativa]|uniref:Methylesterase 13, chloroplastic n=1 Tax=Camelina sativa TaxID=90675 RepID=A0ABM0VS43_CAMSA|nr:PREDICTED: putative methylesterase 13, chloroplastic [Camelina sativa]
MGNSFTCISHEQEQRPKKSSGGGGSNSGKYKYVRRLSLMPSFRRRTLLPSLSCSGSSSTSSSKKGGIKAKTKKIRERHHQDHHGHDKDSHVIQEQTLAATNLLFNQTPRNSNSVVPPSFRRSTSVVYPSSQPSGTSSGPVSAVQTPKKSTSGFVRSSSSRQRSSTDPMIKPNQLVDKELNKVEGSETKRFVLVHGGGFGAWCWYKTITLLEKHGFQVDAIDLTGSGVSSIDTNNITSLAHYSKPLLHFFESLKPTEKVILVGHDFGGACMSYAMEMFPTKISKAVFISAAMLANGQSTLDLFNQQLGSNDLMQQAQIFLYANGKKNPPTAVDFDRSLLRDFLLNQSPPKDLALASVAIRPIPFAPVSEKLHVSDKNYGSIRRFYIKTMEDYAVPVTLQEAMIKLNPPEQVFQLKGSDHAPFFSRPQSLNRILVEISQIPFKKSS